MVHHAVELGSVGLVKPTYKLMELGKMIIRIRRRRDATT
jgi:hypothetical protein